MTFREKVKTLEKLAELGLEDQVIDQTLAKLLDHTIQRHQADLEATEAKLRSLEAQFGMASELFDEKFKGGELGDDEAFFRWNALVTIQRRIAQRLAILQADSST
jgi:translation initiation factor 2 alpha subunit (eIF-2alpha)